MLAMICAYTIQFFAFGTLIITLFINNALVTSPDHPQHKLITQVNWFCIGAALVAAMININAIYNDITSILVIGFVITLVTLICSSACLITITGRAPKSMTKKK